MNTRKVKVHVLLGAHEGERIFSAYPPKEIPPIEWIKRGFTMEAGSAIYRVTPQTGIRDQPEDIPGIPPNAVVIGRPHYRRPYTYTIGFPLRNLPRALEEFETWLIEWLGQLGYDVEFA